MTMFHEVNPVLPAQDVTKSIAYYTSKLGFDLLFQDTPQNPGFAGVRRGHVELHLQRHSAAEWERVERPLLRIRVDDVDTLFTELEGQGVFHAQTKLSDTPWGTREFGFFDPGSNGLTFYCDR